ncbi:TIR domain-containing protein [Methyloceanibacter methanicus]|nr:TIR domain-containing protein [Methyloceanibacter methanicus]
MKIFLGYPAEHENIAREVFGLLTAKGDDVWFDKERLVPGMDWDAERDKGQREADLAIHLCSDAIWERRGVVNREIRQSLRLAEDQPFGARYIIPIRIGSFNLPVELTRFQYFDFGDGWEEQLSSGVEKRREQISVGAPERSRQAVTAGRSHEGLRKVEFENITEDHDCRGEYLNYENEGLYWTYLNGAIAALVLEGYFSALSDFKRLYPDNMGEDSGERKHEWSIRSEEFFRFGDMLSVRFYSYIGLAHAAHPSHYITTLNFFGEDAGSISIQELLGHSPDNARRVIRYCEKVIIAEFEDEIGQDSFFGGYADDEDALWKLLSQFGFDTRGLTFNFSPYDVLPYVLGSHEVLVSWRFMEDLIDADYRDILNRLSPQSG